MPARVGVRPLDKGDIVDRLLTTFLLLLLTLPTAGCDLIGDILQFGFWVLVILIGIIVLLVWVIARMLRGGTRGPGGPRGPRQT